MGVPVVICCAAADERTIAPVLAALGKEGHTVELLPGVEDDAERLTPVVDRFHGEGLYVLCRSRALGRETVDALRDILLAHHVPFGRTLTVASTRPRELKERIAASLRRIASGHAKRLSQVPPEGKASAKRATRQGLPAMTTPSGSKPLPVPPAPKRRATQMGIAAAVPPRPKASPPPAEPETQPEDPDTFEDELPTNTQLPAEPEPKADPPRAETQTDEAPATEAAQVPVSREDSLALAAVITSDDLADLDSVELSATDLEVAEVEEDDDWDGPEQVPVRTGTTTVAKTLTREQVAGAVRTGQTDVAKVIPRSSLEAIRTGDTAIVRRADLIAAGLVDPAAESASRPLAPPAPSPSATPSATPSAPPSSPAVTAEGTAAASSLPWRWIAAGAAAVVLLGVVAVAATGGDDDETNDNADAAASVASADSATRDATKTDEGEGADADGDDSADPAPMEPDPADVDDRTLVGQALRSREIQALDVLLVSNTEGPFDYDGAQSHCGDLDVQGLEQWRLPEVGELMSLTSASMTGRGYYWSATPADTFGDTPLVWHARRGRVVTRSQNNYVVCVRGGTQAG